MRRTLKKMDTVSQPCMFLGLVLGMFFYLFPVVLIPLNIPLALISYVIFLALWTVKPLSLSINAVPIYVVLILIVLSFYSAFVTAVNGMNDFTFAIQIAKVTTLYLGSGIIIGVICVGMRVKSPINVILRAFVVCCVIQSIFISISIFSVQFRLVMNEIILANGNTNYLESFRVRGFSASGGPALSLNQALGVLSSLYLLSQSGKSRYLYIAFFILIPIFFVARTGFYLGVLFILFYFLNINRIRQLFCSIFLKPVGILSFMLVGIVLVVGFQNVGVILDEEAISRLDDAFSWGLEIFFNAQAGSLESETTNALFDMLVVPDELRFLLFGFGVFDIGAFGYERTDSGYLKTLYSSGLIGVCVLYGTLFSALLFSAIRYRQRSFIFYVAIVVLVFVLVEIKEPFLYQNYASRFAFILIGACAVINWSLRTRYASFPKTEKCGYV